MADAHNMPFDSWFVFVNGQSYGPYTDALMRRFVAEGRVGAASQISADPAQGFFEAARYGEFAGWQADLARHGQQPAQGSPARRHLVMAELRSGHSVGFLRELQNFRGASRIGDAVWLVDGAAGTAELTDRLSHTLAPTDRLFVVDITDREAGTWGFGALSRSA